MSHMQMWNLLFFARIATLQTYNSDLTVLEANRQEKSHAFGTESYSTTIKFIWDHFQTRNFNGASTEASLERTS